MIVVPYLRVCVRARMCDCVCVCVYVCVVCVCVCLTPVLHSFVYMYMYVEEFPCDKCLLESCIINSCTGTWA